MAITYVSIAFREFYREKAVKGLCNSFNLSKTKGNLIVYFDSLPSWPAPEGCTFRLLPDETLNNINSGDNSFFSLTSVKFNILDLVIEETQGGVCWVDADALILTDLSKVIVEGKINVVSHGSCDPQEAFDCGKGIVVKGFEFAVGGVFYLPERQMTQELISLAAERETWPEDKKAYWYSDGEQSLLNHIVVNSTDEVIWINNSDYIANWSFLEKRHPYPFDKGLSKVTIEEGEGFAGKHPFAVLSWSSLTLRRHVKQGFRSLQPHTAKQLRQKYYCLNTGPKSIFMQYLYTIYDFFYLKFNN